MRVFFDLLRSPDHFFNLPSASNRLRFSTAVFLLLFMTMLDFILMFQIGSVRGGNPCLWFIIGGLLEIHWVQQQTIFAQWLLLYSIKIFGDLVLIFIPALIARRFYHANKEVILLWAKAYCYYMGILDVFLCLAMLPAVLSGSTAASLLATNLLSYLVFGANMLYFTHAYQASFSVSFDRALRGWFFPAIFLPMSVSAIILWKVV